MAKDKTIIDTLLEDVHQDPAADAMHSAQTAAASDLDPASEGKLRDRSVELGQRVELLRGQSELNYQRQKLAKKQAILEDKTAVAEWMAKNPHNPLLSMDDIEQLGRVYEAAQFISHQQAFPPEHFSFEQQVGATALDVGDKVVGAVGSLSESFYGLLRYGTEKLGAEDVGLPFTDLTLGEFAADRADIGANMSTTLAANLAGGKPEDFEDAEYVQRRMNAARFDVMGISIGDILGAGVSLSPTLLGGWALQGFSHANKLRAFGLIAGTQGFGNTFASQRAAGADFDKAEDLATASGLITGLLTRVIPGGPENALDDMAKRLAVANNPKEMLRANLIRATGVQFVSEALEEGLDETLQAILIDGTTWEEAIDRGLKAGIIGGILGGTLGAAGELAAKRAQESRIALGFRDGLAAVAAELDQSTTAQRSVEAAAEFLQDHGGLNKTAYLDGLAAREIAKTKEGREQLEKAGISETAINTAIKNGTTLPVDTARVLAATSGTVRQNVIDNIRNAPGAQNAVEAELSDDAEITALLAAQDLEARNAEVRAFKTEVDRLTVEVAESLGAKINEKDGKRSIDKNSADYADRAQAQVELLVRSAVAQYNRHPGAFKSPTEFLRSVSFQRGVFDEDVPRGTTAEGAPVDGTEQSEGQELEQSNPNVGTAENMGDSFESRREFFQASQPADVTETAAFQEWAGGRSARVLNPEDVNDFDFSQADGPVVMRLFHGTTHDFTEFDASVGNIEGQFGRVNYFTSSEYDAEVNYAGEGPDLTNRIQQRAERITAEDESIEEDAALEQARKELAGEQERVLELYVKTEKPFVIGDGDSFVEFINIDKINQAAMEQVASDNDLTVEEVEERQDEFEEEIDEARWDIEADTENDLVVAIQAVAERYDDLDSGAIYGQIYEMSEGASTSAIEQFLRGNEGIIYATDPETGKSASSQAIAEVIQELGYDSIVLKDANDRFKNMDMPEPTAHVHIFDEGKTNIKSVENQGTFDGSNPNIFFQSQGQDSTQPLGSMKIVDGRYIVSLFDNANATTVLHEIGHIWQEEVLQAIKSGNATQELGRDWDILSKWQAESTAEHIAWMKKQINNGASDEKAARYRETIAWLENASEQDLVNAAISFGVDTPGELDIPPAVSMGLAESYHEMFARGVEAYLFEGKAPSKALERPFARFARWISRTYKAIFGGEFDPGRDLLVNINEDFKRVLDRLLATDAEIESMMLFNGMEGKTDAEFGDIPGLDVEARGSIQKLFKAASNEIFDEVYRDRVKASKRRRAEFRDQLEKTPLYLAWSYINDNGGLDPALIEAVYGKGIAKELRAKGLVAVQKKDEPPVKGLIDDQVANEFGYEDGEDLVQDLRSAQPIAKQSQLELERAVFDDEMAVVVPEKILDSPSFRKAVDATARALHKALRGNIPMQSRRLISDKALSAIADMEVYDASLVYKYLQEAQRHYNQNRKDLARNKYEEALAELEAGRYSEELARHGRDVRKMSGRILRLAKRIRNTDSQKINYNYAYHAIKTAERFGLIPAQELPAPDFDLLGTIRQDSDAGFVDPAIDFDEWLLAPESSRRIQELEARLAQRYPKPKQRGPRALWQVMRSYELESLESFLGFMERRGKDMADPELFTIEGTVDSIKDEMVERAGGISDRGIPKFDANDIRAKFTEKMAELLDEFVAPDHLYRILDNQKGTVKDQDTTAPWFRLAMAGSARATDLREEISEEVYAAISPHADLLGDAIKRLDNDPALTKLPVPPRMREAGKKRWTGERALLIMLSLGNSYNMSAAASGLGFFQDVTDEVTGETTRVPNTDPLVQMAGLFTKAELEAVQGLWDALELMWPASRKVHQQIYGKPPAKVKGESITLQAKNGPITLAGGYFPLKFDSKDQISNQAQQDDVATLEMAFGNTFAPPHMKIGSLKARSDSGGKLLLLDPLAVIQSHIHSTSTYIAFAPWMRDMVKVFKARIDIADQDGNPISTTMEGLMRRKLGDEAVKQLKGNMRALAGNEEQNIGTFARWVRAVKPLASVFLLAGNIRGPLAVSDAIPSLASDVGWNDYFKEANIFAKDEQGLAAFQFVLKHSKFISRRLKGGFDRDAREVTQRGLKIRKGAKIKEIRDAATDWGMAVYSYPGIAYEMPAWLAVYKRTMRQNPDHDMAVIAADLAIRNTQPSSDTRDQSMAQRNKGGLINMMTMFTGWAITRLNTNRHALRMKREGNLTTGQYAAFTFAQVVLTTLPFALMSAIAYALTGDDEDDEKAAKRFLVEVGRGAFVDSFRGIPLVSNLAQTVFDSLVAGEPKLSALYQAGNMPAMRIVSGVIGKGLMGMYDAVSTDDPEERKEALWNIAHLAAFSTGVPVSRAVERLSDFLFDGSE